MKELLLREIYTLLEPMNDEQLRTILIILYNMARSY